AADVRAGRAGAVPAHLRDGHSRGAAELGHGRGYQYAHDYPGGVAPQKHAPDAVTGREYYRPTTHGAERRYSEVLDRIKEVLRVSWRPGVDRVPIVDATFPRRCLPA